MTAAHTGSLVPNPVALLMMMPADDPYRQERLLFRTVIMQAFYEAQAGDVGAIRWLLTPNRDLQEVCDLAGVERLWIHRIARRVIRRDLQLPSWKVWRFFWASSEKQQMPGGGLGHSF